MLISADSLVELEGIAADSVRKTEPRCVHSVVLRIAGLACAVHFDEATIARRFAARYRDLTVPGADATHHAYVAHDWRGRLFWSRNGPVFVWPFGDVEERAVVFLADAVALTAFFNARTDGVLSAHAAAVGVPGAAGAVVGDTNAGKTTTTIACGRTGLALYSDERCVIDAEGTVHPFPRAINVRAPGRALLLKDMIAGDDPVGRRLRSRGNSEWSDVRFNELFDAWAPPAPAPLRAVFLLAGSSATVRLRPATTGAAIKAAVRWTHGAGGGLDRVVRLYSLFSRVKCLHLELGSPDASARAIRETLLTAAAAAPT